jgi:hypothetical protein
VKPVGQIFVAGQGGAEQVRLVPGEGGEEDIPRAAEPDIVFDNPIVVVVTPLLKEMKYWELDVTRVEIEALMEMVVLQRPEQVIGSRFPRITKSHQGIEVEQKVFFVIMESIE